jgi:hypothetical protein
MKLTPDSVEYRGLVLEKLDLLGVVSNGCGYLTGVVLQSRREQWLRADLFSCFSHSWIMELVLKYMP